MSAMNTNFASPKDNVRQSYKCIYLLVAADRDIHFEKNQVYQCGMHFVMSFPVKAPNI